MNKQFFKLAITNLKKRKLRSALTLIGIVISIMVIFVLISLSLGLQNAILKIFQEMGQDKIFIYSNNLFSGTIGDSAFSIDDVNIVKKVSGVKEIFYSSVDVAKVSANNKVKYLMTMGLPIDDDSIMNLILESFTITVESGTFFKVKQHGKVVLGNKVPELLDNIKVGDRVEINNKTFRIIGILESLGNDQDDKSIYISYSDAENLFNFSKRINMLGCQIDDINEIDMVISRITSRLDNYRNVDEKTRDYIIQKPEDLLKSFSSILLIITVFLIGIGGISIFVGGIGIANTMYTSVLERTKEIGIMKAIGAKKSSINQIFLLESIVLGALGGAVGMILGFFISKAIGYIANTQLNTNYLSPVFPIYMIVLLFLFSIVVGIISGILPSRNAARTNIVDALRYE